MEFKTFQEGAEMEARLSTLNNLIKEISATPEISANLLTRDEFNAQTLALYFKLLPATEIILEARERVNKYKENGI